MVELLLSIVESWVRSRSRSNMVELRLSKVDRSGSNTGGDEGELSILIRLPLCTPLNLNLKKNPL